MNIFIKEVRPSILQSVEEIMIDVSQLLAEMVEKDLDSSAINTQQFASSIELYLQRRFKAKVYSLNKTQANMQVYITDKKGIVIYDSSGERTGKNYFERNDVYLTLLGQYGARTSGSDGSSELEKTMYVAAPITHESAIIGSLTVVKTNDSSRPFIELGRQNIVVKGVVLILSSLVVGLLLSWWFSRSIRKLARFADDVRQGKRVGIPRVREPELAKLSKAMESMRTELEGKDYVEHYIHTFTHEMKSPLAAIKGAAEILTDDIPETDRRRFIDNILNESNRMQQVVNRLLELATVENYKMLDTSKMADINAIIHTLVVSKQAQLSDKNLTINNTIKDAPEIPGDPFLLSQAFNNLIDNAIDFSTRNGTITLSHNLSDYPSDNDKSDKKSSRLSIMVEDNGAGIPDYATHKIFDRFYSLNRPDGGQKSSGLGLSFVEEVAKLHNGDIDVKNNPSKAGATATLALQIIEK